MKKYINYISNGILALLFSQIFIKIIGLGYKLYLTNKEGFGDLGNAVYSSGFQIYALLLTFSSTGVPNAISKLVSEKMAFNNYKGADRIFKIGLIMFAIAGTFGSILLFKFSKYISVEWLQIPEAEISLMVLSPSIFFVSIGAVFRGYFNGMQKFNITAKTQAFEQISKTFFTILLVEIVFRLGKNNVRIMAGAANAATTIATISSFLYIYLFYKMKRRIRISKINSLSFNEKTKDIVVNIFKVALPISLSSVISSFNKNIDSFTVVRYLKSFITENEAKKQYGILSGKVDSICAIAFSFNVAFVTTLVPSISKAFAKHDMEKVKEISQTFLIITFLIGLFLNIIFFTSSKEIFELLFPNNVDGYLYLKYSSFSIIFMLLAQTINAILQGIGEVNIPPITFGLGMIIKFFCNIFLIRIPYIGIYGAIIGNIVCNLFAFSLGFIYLKHKIKLKIHLGNFIFKLIFAILVSYIFSFFVQNLLIRIKLKKLSIIVMVVVYGISYLVMILLMKIITIGQLKKILKEN